MKSESISHEKALEDVSQNLPNMAPTSAPRFDREAESHPGELETLDTVANSPDTFHHVLSAVQECQAKPPANFQRIVLILAPADRARSQLAASVAKRSRAKLMAASSLPVSVGRRCSAAEIMGKAAALPCRSRIHADWIGERGRPRPPTSASRRSHQRHESDQQNVIGFGFDASRRDADWKRSGQSRSPASFRLNERLEAPVSMHRPVVIVDQGESLSREQLDFLKLLINLTPAVLVLLATVSAYYRWRQSWPVEARQIHRRTHLILERREERKWQ